ncbi:hypothetical protein VNO78_15310 [Psophocarpus tetragonolobus]|uniref:S-protein homolog n=1 Tax=Psophocarpus tetragonolobus TaxID=3891 RepID=A0AAN9SEE2_PSOTE
MSLFARSVCTLWMFILLSSWVNYTVAMKALVRVTNDLGILDLTVSCNIDKNPHILTPAAYYEWNYSSEDSEFGREPFTCNFQWEGAHHSFDMYVSIRDQDCQRCLWFIRQDAPCRYVKNGRFACYPWNT